VAHREEAPVTTGLAPRELDLVRQVLARHPEVAGAILFGSRAKGTATAASDVDLALDGVDEPLQAAAIARELDELPLPYRFDVQALSAIRHAPLLEHIARVGVRIHPA
jgi:predicted nucleotidyltransferase